MKNIVIPSIVIFKNRKRNIFYLRHARHYRQITTIISNWLLKYLSSDDDDQPILRDGSLRQNSNQVPIIPCYYNYYLKTQCL